MHRGRSVHNKIPGFIFVTLGLVLLTYNIKIPYVDYLFNWFIMFFLAGVLWIFAGFSRNSPTAVMSGGTIAAVSLFAWGKQHLEWSNHWSFLLILLSIAIILTFFVNFQPITGLTGISLLLCGIFAYPGSKKIGFLAPIVDVMSVYWPTLLIILGFIFILRK